MFLHTNVREEEENVGKVKVADAVVGEYYYAEGDDQILLECIRVTKRRGVFENEDGDRINLSLDKLVIPKNKDAKEESSNISKEDLKNNKDVEDATKSESPSKKTRARRSKKPSVTRIIKELVCENPEVTVNQICDYLNARDFKFSQNTVEMGVKDTLVVIEILKNLGKLK